MEKPTEFFVGHGSLFKIIPEDPAFSTGVDPFSNANIYALDQLLAETKTDLESTTCPLLSLILH